MAEGHWAELKSEKDWSWEGDFRAGGNGRKEWKEQRSRSWQEDNFTSVHIAANSATVYYPKFTWNKEDKSRCRDSSRIIPIPPVRHPAQSNWAPWGCLGAGYARWAAARVCCAPHHSVSAELSVLWHFLPNTHNHTSVHAYYIHF